MISNARSQSVPKDLNADLTGEGTDTDMKVQMKTTIFRLTLTGSTEPKKSLIPITDV